MRGYNEERISKPAERKTTRKVLSVLNNVQRWTRVSSKSLEFYREKCEAVSEKKVNDHRIEYFDKDGRCVMVYEF